MPETPKEPPVRSAGREAIVVLGIWFAAMTYSVTYCYCYGYGRDRASLRFVLGFPDWVFWGLLVPWVICIVLSWWFSHVFMRDEDLGEDREETDHA